MYPIELSLSRPKNILTVREEEVLIELINGKNNYEIANDLYISVHTVKFHVASILQKFKKYNPDLKIRELKNN